MARSENDVLNSRSKEFGEQLIILKEQMASLKGNFQKFESKKQSVKNVKGK